MNDIKTIYDKINTRSANGVSSNIIDLTEVSIDGRGSFKSAQQFKKLIDLADAGELNSIIIKHIDDQSVYYNIVGSVMKNRFTNLTAIISYWNSDSNIKITRDIRKDINILAAAENKLNNGIENPWDVEDSMIAYQFGPNIDRLEVLTVNPWDSTITDSYLLCNTDGFLYKVDTNAKLIVVSDEKPSDNKFVTIQQPLIDEFNSKSQEQSPA